MPHNYRFYFVKQARVDEDEGHGMTSKYLVPKKMIAADGEDNDKHVGPINGKEIPAKKGPTLAVLGDSSIRIDKGRQGNHNERGGATGENKQMFDSDQNNNQSTLDNNDGTATHLTAYTTAMASNNSQFSNNAHSPIPPSASLSQNQSINQTTGGLTTSNRCSAMCSNITIKKYSES